MIVLDCDCFLPKEMYCKQVLIAEANLFEAEGLRVHDFHFEPNSGQFKLLLPMSWTDFPHRAIPLIFASLCTDCVKLLMEGVVPILDEQTQLAQGSDKRLISDIYSKNKHSSFLLLPHARNRHEAFYIRHCKLLNLA